MLGTMKVEHSGQIWIDGDRIHYSSPSYGDWQLALREIRVIGEYTNQNGPFAVDYFLAFVTDPELIWLEASFYAEGREAFLEKLGARLGQVFQCSLCASTDFDSRVWWPVDLAGQPMFDFREEGLLGKLGLTNRQYLSASIIDFLND